jgi:hypothetical protein
VVLAGQTVEQLVAQGRRALVVHVPRLQDPQSTDEPAVAIDEHGEPFRLLWHEAVARPFGSDGLIARRSGGELLISSRHDSRGNVRENKNDTPTDDRYRTQPAAPRGT